MGRAGIGAFGVFVVAVALLARQTAARSPCGTRFEHLKLTLQEVRIDGAVATTSETTWPAMRWTAARRSRCR